MEASSVMHQVMNSHSLEEVLSCAKQTQQAPHQQQMHQQQQIMSGPTDQQQMQMQQQQDASDQSKRLKPQPEQALRCPRCDSTNTKFCYYNNYSLSQPRYFCKGCRRYWTQGGTLRNVPVGGGCRKKRPSSTVSSAAAMAAKMNKIQVVASASQADHHGSSPVPTPDPGASPLHLSHSAPPSSLGYDPGDLSLAFARLQQKTQQQQHMDENNAAAFLHLLPGGGGCGTAAAAGGNGFLDFLRSGSGFLDGNNSGNGAFCNSYAGGFSGSGLMLGSASGDSDSPFLPLGEVASNAASVPTPSVPKQEACSRGVLDGGDAKAMMGFHHQWAPHHQQLAMQQPFYTLVGGGPGAGAGAGSAANGAGYDAGFASGFGGTAMDYWSNLGPAVSWHGLVNSSLM